MGSPFRISHATGSLGVASTGYTLVDKLDAIAEAGFDAIELSFSDLVSFAQQHLGRRVADDDYTGLCQAAAEVRELCRVRGLSILVLQPLINFESWERGSPQRTDAFNRAQGWMKIMEAAGIQMLQVGSSDAFQIVGSIISPDRDLIELADLLAPRGFRMAYENWCWGTHVRTWKDAWEVVRRSNRSNLGLCLDTFQIAGSEWADPTTRSGLIENGPSWAELEKRFQHSLKELSRTVPKEKIFMFQISDAYKLGPLSPSLRLPLDKDVLRPKGQWSHLYRPLPFQDGYLPVVQVAKAVLDTGYTGYISIETFDGKQKDKYGGDLKVVAQKGKEVCDRLLQDVQAGGGWWSSSSGEKDEGNMNKGKKRIS